MVSQPDSLGAQVSLDGNDAAPQQVLPPGFDGLQYIASYGDLIQAFGTNAAAGERHYLDFGEAEGRATDTFNEDGYLERYPDLQAAFRGNTDAATRHYIEFGFGEGRTYPPAGLPPGFDGLQYIASYGDLIQAFGTNVAAGERHYLDFGQAEGREINTFDEAQYLENYQDLRDAFGDNTDAATAHYIQHGFGEGRSDEPLEPGNTAPTAAADTGAATEDGGPVTLDVLANDTDPDEGDTLTVASVDATADTTGTPTLEADGSVVYDLGDNGQELAEGQTTTDSFEYTVQDAAGAESTAAVTITVTGVNDAPTAVADTIGATEDGGPVAVDVLGNDTDVDQGDTRTVTSVDNSGTIGIATLLDGSVTYDPGAEFQDLGAGATRTDVFAYTVQDAAGAQDTATVTVTVTGVDEPPPPPGGEPPPEEPPPPPGGQPFSADFLF
jgi:VCBS repeat-containing protein